MLIMEKPQNRTSRYHGVYKNVIYPRKPWSVTITACRKSFNLGYYITEVQAAKAYDFFLVIYGKSPTNEKLNPEIKDITLHVSQIELLNRRLERIKKYSVSDLVMRRKNKKCKFTQETLTEVFTSCSNLHQASKALGISWQTAQKLKARFEQLS